MGLMVPFGFRLSKSTYGSIWSVTTRVTRILCGRLSCFRQVNLNVESADFAREESDISSQPSWQTVRGDVAEGGSLALKRRFFTPSEFPSDG